MHRERASHATGELEHALAALQAEVYQCPESLFGPHAHDRAEAMLLRDAAAEAGTVPEQVWQRIGSLLDSSWTALGNAVAQQAIAARR